MSFMIWQQMEQSFSDSEQLQAALFLFVEAIKCADSANAKNWALRSVEEENKIRLLAGRFIVCTLSNGKIWCALDEASLKENKLMRNDLEEDPEWKWDQTDYPRYSFAKMFSRNGYFSAPSEEYPLMDTVKYLHLAYVDRVTSRTSLKRETIAGHESRILDFLKHSTGTGLPSPIH